MKRFEAHPKRSRCGDAGRRPHGRDALLRLAGLLEENGERFGPTIALDNGSPLAIGGGRGNRPGLDRLLRPAGRTNSMVRLPRAFTSDTDFTYSMCEPYGVIGIIITWNGPLISLGMKVSRPWRRATPWW